MTDKTQIETDVEALVSVLRGGSDSEADEAIARLLLLVNPKPKEPKQTAKEKRHRDDDPTKDGDKKKAKKDVEERQLNPALVLKSLNEHFEALTAFYEAKRHPKLAVIMSRILMVFHQDDALPKRLTELLLQAKPEESFETWGVDFIRNAGIMAGRDFVAGNARALEIVKAAVGRLFEAERTVEAMDCCLEAGELGVLEPFVTGATAWKTFYYVEQNLFYGTGVEKYRAKLEELAEMCLSKGVWEVCLHVGVELCSRDLIRKVYDFITHRKELGRAELLQFAFVLSSHPNLQEEYFHSDQVIHAVLQNGYLAGMFKKAGQKLGLEAPKSVDDVLKREDIEIDWAKFSSYQGNFFQNAFTHLGHQDDLLFNSHVERAQEAEVSVNESQVATQAAEPAQGKKKAEKEELIPEGHRLFFGSRFEPSKAEVQTAVAAAGLGLHHIWGGYQNGFDALLKYTNSPEKWVRVGALLAMGFAAHGTRPDGPFDYLYGILAGQFNPYMEGMEFNEKGEIKEAKITAKNLPALYTQTLLNKAAAEHIPRTNTTIEYSHTKEAFAALSLGVAYMGTGDERVIKLLVNRLRTSSDSIQPDLPLLEKHPRGFACLALGLVAAGTCDTAVADVILRVMAGNSRSQRVLRFFPLCAIGLGLIFLKASAEKETGEKVEAFCAQMVDKLNAVQKPDSPQERIAVTAQEDNVQLAAYLQTIAMIFSNAGLGNLQLMQDLMQALTDAIQGRVAAEEAVNISRFDREGTKKDQQPQKQESMNEYVAETGQPLLLPGSDRNIWPGINMDPASILVLGIGFIAGKDEIAAAMIPRFAERILRFGNISAQRAVPLLLALTSLSQPRPELVDDLAKLALNTDKTMSFNALLALGLIGCGTGNFKVAGVLRHSLESKCYSEENIEHVVLGVQVAFGLLYAGKGMVSLEKESIPQLASLATVLCFTAPSADVMLRPKCNVLFYLLACAMRPKVLAAVDTRGIEQTVSVRSGRAIEELQGEKPFRLAGFALHQTPILTALQDQVAVVDEKWEPVYDGLKGVGGTNVFVVREKRDEKEKKSTRDEKEDLYT